MNIEELREQLDLLAGPASVTPDAREGVRHRVRRTRRRASATSAMAAVLVVAVVAVGVRDARRSPIDVKTVASSTAAPAASCRPGVGTVPAKDVPRDVAKWADGAPVVGHGALWTIRSAMAAAPTWYNGTWLLKFPWFTRPFGLPRINGHRIDGPGSFRFDAGSATDQGGTWVVSSLEFSALGCWEVTASYRNVGIVFRILVRDIGTIAGTLREVGGPSPGLDRAIAGTVTITGRSGFSVRAPTNRNGFSVDLPVGTYTVTGTSLSINDGHTSCSAGGPVAVARGLTTVAVICPIK